MMDKELIESLEPLEEKFDVVLLTEAEVQEFLASDLKFMEEAFDEEITSARKTQEYFSDTDGTANAIGYIAGLRRGLEIARTWYDTRIDDGF